MSKFNREDIIEFKRLDSIKNPSKNDIIKRDRIFSKIYEENIFYKKFLYSKFYSVNNDKVDCETAYNLSLLRALRYYDINKDIKFSYYLSRLYVNELHYIMRRDIVFNKIAINESYIKNRVEKALKDGGSYTMDEFESKEEIRIEEQQISRMEENFIQLVNNCKDMDDNEKILLIGDFLGDSQTEIAKRANVTQSCVSRKLNKFRKNMKLAKDGN